MKLDSHANNVLQKFGNIIPEHILSFEDVKTEFLGVYSTMSQKLGIADTDKTVSEVELSLTSRDELLNLSIGEMIPAFCEIQLFNAPTSTRLKVEIVPPEDIPSYEGSYAISFYGEPVRARLAFDAWTVGTLYLFADNVPDLSLLRGSSNISFPTAFLNLLEEKTRLFVIDKLRLKLAWIQDKEIEVRLPLIMSALDKMEQSALAKVGELEMEFKKWRNKDLNETPHLRRTNDEILRRSYNNITRTNPLEYVG